jgi:hypothetical protein
MSSSLVANQPAAPAPARGAIDPELRALFAELSSRLEATKQELKSDIQSKLPSSRRFSWVLLFIAVQVVQGIIVVRYTVHAASTALDSARIPEMTARYADALHTSQDLVSRLNHNVTVLSGLVAETTDAWKQHVQGFVRELPKMQEGYQKAAARFSEDASALPARIVDRFFEAEEVKRSMTAYNASVQAAAGSVQQRSDEGIDTALRAYRAQLSGPPALAHFEGQVEKQFAAGKVPIADAVASGMKEAVQASSLKEKLASFWDASLTHADAPAGDGWLYRRLRDQGESAAVEKSLIEAVDAALAPPLTKWFAAQLQSDGPLAELLARDMDKVPRMPQLVQDVVRRKVDVALSLPGDEKLPPLADVLRDVVKSRVNVTLAALAPVKGPVVLTCK